MDGNELDRTEEGCAGQYKQEKKAQEAFRESQTERCGRKTSMSQILGHNPTLRLFSQGAASGPLHEPEPLVHCTKTSTRGRAGAVWARVGVGLLGSARPCLRVSSLSHPSKVPFLSLQKKGLHTPYAPGVVSAGSSIRDLKVRKEHPERAAGRIPRLKM